ncbi:hypothetical protein [Actinacidiphila oryziradicis]|uniref:Uncharacterized protein n=1 Tax=Actinacidiphila oryziradicis TaxID=2571141 RepID=A0A4U0RQ29_9ACTN|nr:hypothetical protein [Actinacidiphila oryziradicis]TJZ97446.1 hypothetical protein FCI23_49665 [Actinacidiphila oryziradicis]
MGELVRVTKAAELAPQHPDLDGGLENLAPAASAALRLLADAVKRGGADHGTVLQAIKDACIHEAFADVLDAAAGIVMDGGLEDPFEFDGRQHAENLGAVASDVRCRDFRCPYNTFCPVAAVNRKAYICSIKGVRQRPRKAGGWMSVSGGATARWACSRPRARVRAAAV